MGTQLSSRGEISIGEDEFLEECWTDVVILLVTDECIDEDLIGMLDAEWADERMIDEEDLERINVSDGDCVRNLDLDGDGYVDASEDVEIEVED